MSRRIDFIDFTRGAAALLVLASHAMEVFVPGWERTFQYINLGQIGVVAFFLVSGYVIPYSLEKSGKIKQFILGRIFRIYPLYLFTGLSIFLLFYSGFYAPPGNPDHSWLKIIGLHLFFAQDLPYGDAGMINLVPGNWTLFIEAIWYGLFAFLFFARISKNIKAITICYNSFLIILIIISLGWNIRLPYGRFCLIGISLIGYMHYAFSQGNLSLKTFRECLIYSLLALFIALIVTFGYFKNDTFSLLCVLLSWSLGLALYYMFYKISAGTILTKTLSYLGKISYSVYLTHPILIYIVYYFTRPNHILTGLVLCAFLPVIISVITYTIIEKPALSFSRTYISGYRA